MEKIKKQIQRNSATLLLLLFCVVLAALLSLKTGKFLDFTNFINILEANSYRMLLAIGMMLVVSSGAIDLSAGAILSFSSILMALCLKSGCPVWLGVGAGLLAGSLMGAVNGTLIGLTKINAFIITLSTSFLFRGLSLIVTKGSPITKLPAEFLPWGSGRLWDVEVGVFLAGAAVAVVYLLFYKMKWGHYVTALGGNPEALNRCGISTMFYRISVFAAMGLLAALAGLIITARLNSAEPNAGLNMEMDAICAVIMGGTLLHGGRGNVPGTVAAVFLLGMIRNALTLLSISPYYQQFITGAILLLAVVVAELRERKRRVAH